MINDEHLIALDILKYIGIVLVIIGVLGFILSSIFGIFKIIEWWQSILSIIVSILVIVIGFICFKEGKYFKHTKTKRL